jgi:predicted Zn-ribbon and HTH transcriptional regulator
MSELFLVPAGDSSARLNFERTIRAAVSERDLDGLDPSLVELARAVHGGVRAWGTKPGRDDRHVGTWSRMERGDWVLFGFDGLFPVAARVLARAHSPAVARRIWGEDEGETWEYMYLLDEVRQVDIPRLGLNERLGYRPDNYVQGFSRVRPDVEKEFGSIEQFLEQLADRGHQLRLAIEAARAGEEMEAATLLDRLGEISERQLRKEVEAFSTAEKPKAVKQLVEKLQRNHKLVEKLKKLYEGKCQLCGFTFQQRNARPYCEAAHLKPMARREANIDVKDNLFILCPNHHKMLDYGSLRLEWNAAGNLVGVIDGKSKRLTNKHVTRAPTASS